MNTIQYLINQAIFRGVSEETIILLILLPLVASAVAAARHLLGFRGFGILIPTAIAVTFVVTGISTGIFVFLSAICHPRAQFTGLSVDENGSRLTLGLKTENFKTLGEQLLILKSNPQVSDVNFSGLSIDREGKIICSLSFNLDPKIIIPSLGL